MRVLMLSLVVLLELNLYIILASSLSVNQNHVKSEQQEIKASEELYYYSQRSETSYPATMMISSTLSSSVQPQLTTVSQHQSPSDVVLRDNKMDDLFLGTPSTREQEDDERKHEYQLPKHTNLAAYNTINLDNSLEFEPEMLTNNHQSTSYEPPSSITTTNSMQSNQNSRHYNNYQSSGSGLSSMHSNHHHHYNHQHLNHHQQQNQHYGRYSPNMFANNYNLNYIHSFLTNKPSLLSSSPASLPSSSSSSLSSLPSDYSHNSVNANSVSQYSSASSSTHQQSNGFASYISASSALSTAVNNLQQTIAQKQQQLASINNQLQSLAGGSSILSPFLSSSGRDMVLQSQSNSVNHNNNVNATNENFQEPSAVCGRQQVAYREPRIVGGNRTYEGEFPWAVSIQRHGNHHCGGVIVGRRWILTAAHCVRSQLVGNLAVRTGGHTLSRSPNGISSHLEKDYQVEQIFMHDDFSRYDNLTASQLKSSANTNNADIALLKLKHEIRWNDLAWPVCFPDRDAGNFSGHEAIVIGWGKLNEKSEEFSNELQKVKLTIIDNKVCQNWFRQAGRDMPIDDRIICAGFKHGGKDACHGDSGGPLLSRINGQYVVVGVVSTGIGCARPLLPGLYSRVSSYISWIERHITI